MDSKVKRIIEIATHRMAYIRAQRSYQEQAGLLIKLSEWIIKELQNALDTNEEV